MSRPRSLRRTARQLRHGGPRRRHWLAGRHPGGDGAAYRLENIGMVIAAAVCRPPVLARLAVGYICERTSVGQEVGRRGQGWSGSHWVARRRTDEVAGADEPRLGL